MFTGCALAGSAEETGVLSAQVALLNRLDSEHQAPLTDLAEWLSQNLQDDLQGDAMVSSPTHPSRWGPLAPAGIVESKRLFWQEMHHLCTLFLCLHLSLFPPGNLLYCVDRATTQSHLLLEIPSCCTCLKPLVRPLTRKVPD